MAAEDLGDIVQSLTPEEQQAVRRFIEYLKGRALTAGTPSPFLHAADEFIAEHPELLRRLAR